MPYKDPEKQRLFQKIYYPLWYKKNGRNRSIEQIEAIYEWRRNHPEAVRTFGILRYAIKTGKIIKPLICDSCKESKRLHAHHDDYTKPLEVKWLCASCHKIYHNGPAPIYPKPVLRIFRCKRCGWEWPSTSEHPRNCPNLRCHSRLWDKVPKRHRCLNCYHHIEFKHCSCREPQDIPTNKRAAHNCPDWREIT